MPFFDDLKNEVTLLISTISKKECNWCLNEKEYSNGWVFLKTKKKETKKMQKSKEKFLKRRGNLTKDLKNAVKNCELLIKVVENKEKSVVTIETISSSLKIKGRKRP